MVMNSMIKKQPVPESSRFNWKNGFYSLEKMEIYKAMNEKAEAEKEAGFNRYPAKGKGRPAGRGRGGNGKAPQNGRNRRR